eukprot:TRINITY_DN18975_c0_g1_i1.p1 TRINITY_DN18975_c0_g1~~TRINITY_DN18975_c0_g1_i1.p1  ORF type:complete len:163 (-),score=24.40 TRINITY_DN18975_c0_g1_i1:43-531(-)
MCIRDRVQPESPNADLQRPTVTEQLLGQLGSSSAPLCWAGKTSMVTSQTIDALARALVAVPSGCILHSHESPASRPNQIILTESLRIAPHAFLLPGLLAQQLHAERSDQLHHLEVNLRQISARVDLEMQLCAHQADLCDLGANVAWLEKRADLLQLLSLIHI